MERTKLTLTLKWTNTIGPAVKHFAFELNSGQSFDYLPGQFITIHFTSSDKAYRRSYSIASVPGDELIEFAVGYIEGGPGSKYLFSLEPGDKISTTGPFGRLILRGNEHPKRYILVATSTGITPYLSMLIELDKRLRAETIKVIVLLGARTRQDLIYSKEFLQFADKHPNFEFRAQYSREILTDPKPYEYKGYVQTAFSKLNLEPENDIVYLCGNPYMVDDAYAQLKALGFEVKSVRREKYISGK